MRNNDRDLAGRFTAKQKPIVKKNTQEENDMIMKFLENRKEV